MRCTVLALALGVGLGACGEGEGDDDTGPVCDSDGDGYDGAQCDGDDCDDTTGAYHPGAAEQCNGVDDDCDPATTDYTDVDGDGILPCAGDCNDLDPSMPESWWGDEDGDGVCESGDCDDDESTLEAVDCNDCDPTIHSNANEVPGDGQDNDCDGKIDES